MYLVANLHIFPLLAWTTRKTASNVSLAVHSTYLAQRTSLHTIDCLCMLQWLQCSDLSEGSGLVNYSYL